MAHWLPAPGALSAEALIHGAPFELALTELTPLAELLVCGDVQPEQPELANAALRVMEPLGLDSPLELSAARYRLAPLRHDDALELHHLAPLSAGRHAGLAALLELGLTLRALRRPAQLLALEHIFWTCARCGERWSSSSPHALTCGGCRGYCPSLRLASGGATLHLVELGVSGELQADALLLARLR